MARERGSFNGGQLTCHALGGADHRCEGKAVKVLVYFDKHGEYAKKGETSVAFDRYSWCPKAINLARRQGATVEEEDNS